MDERNRVLSGFTVNDLGLVGAENFMRVVGLMGNRGAEGRVIARRGPDVAEMPWRVSWSNWRFCARFFGPSRVYKILSRLVLPVSGWEAELLGETRVVLARRAAVGGSRKTGCNCQLLQVLLSRFCSPGFVPGWLLGYTVVRAGRGLIDWRPS
jgi:hypothetical protein